jgi:hypothetical protein
MSVECEESDVMDGTVSVGVGPSLSERLPTYLYHRGSGPNVVRNVKSVGK